MFDKDLRRFGRGDWISTDRPKQHSKGLQTGRPRLGGRSLRPNPVPFSLRAVAANCHFKKPAKAQRQPEMPTRPGFFLAGENLEQPRGFAAGPQPKGEK
jgi:hypothetical protein